jgi:hypothetical protein
MIANILNEAKTDPSLFSTLNMDEILKSIQNEKHDYLENKSLKTISAEIYHQLNVFPNVLELCDKLKEYFLVNELAEFRKSHHIRFIKKNGDNKLHVGGILLDINQGENGMYLSLLAFGKRFIRVKIDDYIFFQKLTPDEKIIILSFDYLEEFEKENSKAK